MKILKVLISILVIFILILVYALSMTLIKNEDFIGSFYSVSIKPDIALEICGTSTQIIDQKKDETIICDIDSMTIVEDTVYGISNNRYFLLTISNKKVVYSSIPMLQYSTDELVSPLEYYQTKTRHINIIGGILLFTCIIITIKKGIINVFKGGSRFNHRDKSITGTGESWGQVLK